MASMLMPRRRPRTRSPEANSVRISSTASPTSWSVRTRRTSLPVTTSTHVSRRVDHDQDAARRRRERRVEPLGERAGVALDGSDEDRELEAGDLLGRPDRLVEGDLLGRGELAGHRGHHVPEAPPVSRALSVSSASRPAVDDSSSAGGPAPAEPLVVGVGAGRRDRLTTDDARQIDRSEDHSGDQQRDADEDQQVAQDRHRRRVAPAPTGMSAAAGPAYASTRSVAEPTTSAARRGARDFEVTR